MRRIARQRQSKETPMAKHLAIALSAAFLCSMSAAQNQTPSATEPSATQAPQNAATQAPGASPAAENQAQPSSPRLAPGSVIPVQLTKTVDAKKAKPGDEIVATVTHDLKSNTGEVIVPKDTKIMGHITEAQARTKEQKESELGIAFDRALTKNGEMRQPMSIQAIIAPLDNSSSADRGNSQGAPVTGGSTASSPMGSRNTAMGGAPPPSPPSPGAATGTDATAGSSARPPINGNTQGVIGMPELKLEANAQNAPLGSVMSSGKGNVKLESGTLMLLRVNP
jgi:hypothetical protein